MASVTGERDTVLLAAAQAEYFSNHPVARSVVAAAKPLGFEPSPSVSATELAGRGVVARDGDKETVCGNLALMTERGITVPTECDARLGTVVYVAVNGEYLGAIEIADAIKEDSEAALSALKAQGVRTVMLTGDNARAASAVAARVGVDEFRAELLPDMKVAEVEKIIEAADGGNGGNGGKSKRRRKRGAVAFVGDGINDAPVLSRADVGIAMGAIGSDAAIEAADVVFMNSAMSAIPQALLIARATGRIAKQNVIFALVIKAAVMVLGLAGLANMWMAVFADTGVAMLCILNSIRILYKKI